MSALVLLTGATSGIGRATALLLARSGYRLVLTGRRADRLEEVATACRTLGVEVKTLCFDVQDAAATEMALSALPASWMDVEVLINNAGLSQGLNPVHEGLLSDWDIMLDTNVKGLLTVSRWVSQKMIARGNGGHILNVSSIAGKEVYANGNVYCASKHAVEAITKSMRLELNAYDIKVSSIAPGLVETEFSEVRFKGDKDRAAQVYKGYQPLLAEDVAEAILFMLNRPAHVNIADLTILPKAQASSTLVKKQL